MVTLTAEGQDRLDALVHTIAEEGTIPGFVVGATSADGEIYLSAGGKNIVGDKASGDVDPSAVFWLCSSTKLVTHIAALQLIERGQLDLDAPVSDFLPQVKDAVLVNSIVSDALEVIGPVKTILRVKHLMNSSAGSFYAQTPDAGFAMNAMYANEYITDDKHAEFLDILKGQLPGIPLKYEPGTSFIYGYSSDILGLIIEKVTEQTLDQYMCATYLATAFSDANLEDDLRAKMLPIAYRRPVDGRLEPYSNQPNVKLWPSDPSKVICLGGAGLYMSIQDYLRLLRHILQILDEKASKPILRLETVQSLFISQLTDDGEKNLNAFAEMLGYPGTASWSNAFSVNTTNWSGRRKARSGSWGGWLGTNYWIDPTTGVAGMMGTQLLCTTSGACDPGFIDAYARFEEALYGSLSKDK